MTITDHCTRPAQTIAPTDTVQEAARRMRDEHVGSLVVVDDARKPVGMLTDRDICLKLAAEARPADATPVRELMSANVDVLPRTASLRDATATMRNTTHRRLPLVDEHGRLDGVVTVDDLFQELAKELDDLADTTRAELAAEKLDGQSVHM